MNKSINKDMEANRIAFSGSIPQAYEEYLGPFLFEPFALDLVRRIGHEKIESAVEIGCGTGRVTRHLRNHLNESVFLIASDLNPEMLSIAREKLPARNIFWDVVDVTNIQYLDESCDLVVCQFSLMLVPDKEKAFSEIYRILRKGGRLIFNVWGEKQENEIWDIGMKVVGTFLGGSPVPQDISPFSMADNASTIRLLEQVGFEHFKSESVRLSGTAASATLGARGFLQGLPIAMAIRKKDPALIFEIEAVLAQELAEKLGDNPLRSALSALIYEVVK